jgi:hypothetical protein
MFHRVTKISSFEDIWIPSRTLIQIASRSLDSTHCELPLIEVPLSFYQVMYCVDVTLETIRADHLHVGEIDATQLRSVHHQSPPTLHDTQLMFSQTKPFNELLTN